MPSALRLGYATLLVVAIACASCAFELRPSKFHYNFVSQASHELFERWRTVNGLVAGIQVFSITPAAQYTQLDVCYIPPFEQNPSIDRASELLGTIRDATTFQPLFVFRPSMACYADISAINTCVALRFVSYGVCSDANLFVNPETLETTISEWLRVPSLGSPDPRLIWSQLVSYTSNAMLTMEIALNNLDNATYTSNTSVSLGRLFDDVSARVSTNSQLLSSLYSLPSDRLYPLQANWTLTMQFLLTDAANTWAQLKSALLSTSGTLSFSNEATATSLQENMRKWFELLPRTTLQAIGTMFAHLKNDFSQPQNFAALPDANSRFSQYLPSQLAQTIDEISLQFYEDTTSLINQMRANFLPKLWLDCYAHKLASIQTRFNMTAYVSGAIPGWNNVMKRGLQQGYGMFEEDPAGDCSNALYTHLLSQASNANSPLLVSFDFVNVTTRTAGAGESLEISENSPWNRTSIMRGFSVLASNPLPINFSNESYTSTSTEAVLPNGVMTLNLSSAILFDTLTSPAKKRSDHLAGILEDSQLRRGGVEKRSEALISCQPGYFALYNDATGLFECVGCPVGSYCLGNDGLQRLCSNGPFDRVRYTQPYQTNSSCPFVCSVTGECRIGSDCVVPGAGQYCLNGWQATCPSSSFPELWHFQAQCSAIIDWSVSISPINPAQPCSVESAASESTWCRFSLAPFGSSDVSLRLRFEDPFAISSTVNLIQSSQQYRVDLFLNATTQDAYVQLTIYSFLGSPQNTYKSLSSPVYVGNWHTLRIVTASLNYIMMFWDDRPTLYSFFNAQKQTTLVPYNSGYVTISGYGTPMERYSLSNLIFSSFNTTKIADWRRETPQENFQHFCDLSVSSIADSLGTCVTSSCPNGQHREEVDSGLYLCLCDGNGESTCDQSLSSSNDCGSGEYLSWMGSYLMIEFTNGGGFFGSLELVDENGDFVQIQDCTDVSPLGFTCLSAFANNISPPSLYGWHISSGQSAVFFLPAGTSISEISFNLRSDSILAPPLLLSIYLSTHFSELLQRNPEAQLCNDWSVQPPALDLASFNQGQSPKFVLNAYKARLIMLENAHGNGFKSKWSKASVCLLCPSRSSISLDPRLGIRDCVCSDNTVIPDRKNGCLEQSNCSPHVDLELSPPPGLYAPPVSISFNSSSKSLNLSEIYVDVSVQDQFGTVMVVSLGASDSFDLRSSSTVTFSANTPGCSPSIKKSAQYVVKPECLKPLIVSGGSSGQKVVSIFSFPGTSIEVAVDPLPASTKSTPLFQPYLLPIRVTTDSLVRARSFSTSGACSKSDTSYSFIVVSSAQVEPNGTPSTESLKCGSACVGIIIGACIMGVIVLALIAVLVLNKPKVP